ncbi:MAG TPA: DUF1365 domain-containing protein [Luteitalea sp.]|nr:DUF1365 domain-containing protein [Luteitalea sp.]
MSATAPSEHALYVGQVWHRRATPQHAFRYRTYLHAFDLDALDTLPASSRLVRYNRRGIVGLHDADHFDGRPLRQGVEHAVVSRGHVWPGGRVVLLTHCRVLGYVFNPVSFFYCHDGDGQLALVVAEVNNTYGERHVYVLPVPEGHGVTCEKKAFHVSPFFGLDGTYRFTLEPPDAHCRVGIALTVARQPVFSAHLDLTRTPLTDAALLGVLARYPLVTAQVIAAIHFEALRLWWKGVRFRDKPAYAPESARQTEP